MEGIKAISYTICFTAVLTGGAMFLMPQGTFSKMMKYVLAICALATVLCAVKGTKLSLDVKQISQNNKSTVNEKMLNGQAEYTVTQLLSANEIFVKKVVCITDNTDANNIVINKAEIYTNESKERVTQALQPLNIKEVIVIYDE